MYINITTLENYLLQHGMQATTSIDIEDNTPLLKFTKGKDKDGSRVEFLTFNQLYEILAVNHMFGKDGVVTKERDTSHEDALKRPYNKRDKSKNIDDMIYGTLAKYIIQMLGAGTGQIFYPELLPLPGHKDVYFREE
jgi:hypothetical protein